MLLDGWVLITDKPAVRSPPTSPPSPTTTTSPPKQLILITGVIRDSAVMRYDFPARRAPLQIALINTGAPFLKLLHSSPLPLLLCSALLCCAADGEKAAHMALRNAKLHNPPTPFAAPSSFSLIRMQAAK